MEPFTIFALLMSIGGVISGADRRDQREKLRSAAERLRSARNSAKDVHDSTVESMTDLAANRAASLWWLYPRLDAAILCLGLPRRDRGRLYDIFGGRTRAEIKQLAQTIRKMIMPPNNIFGHGVALTSSAALLIEGVQFLDKMGAIDVPALHQTLHEVMPNLPVAGNDAFSSALGGIGDMPVADLISDGLVIFSACKLAYNLFKSSDYSQAASGMDNEVKKLGGLESELRKLGKNTKNLKGNLSNSAYEVFKCALIIEVLNERPADITPRLQQVLIRDLQAAASSWWESLSKSVSLHRA